MALSWREGTRIAIIKQNDLSSLCSHSHRNNSKHFGYTHTGHMVTSHVWLTAQEPSEAASIPFVSIITLIFLPFHCVMTVETPSV